MGPIHEMGASDWSVAVFAGKLATPGRPLATGTSQSKYVFSYSKPSVITLVVCILVIMIMKYKSSIYLDF